MLKQISKLIQYFISDGNETFFMLCEYGTIKLIESAGQKKDEKKTQDSQIQIIVYRTGLVSSDTGLSVLLMARKKQIPGYTDELLKSNGYSQVSDNILTNTAYMTTEAQKEITPSVIKVFFNMMKYVKPNPQCFMLDIFDVFGLRLSSLLATAQRCENKPFTKKRKATHLT